MRERTNVENGEKESATPRIIPRRTAAFMVWYYQEHNSNPLIPIIGIQWLYNKIPFQIWTVILIVKIILPTAGMCNYHIWPVLTVTSYHSCGKTMTLKTK